MVRQPSTFQTNKTETVSHPENRLMVVRCGGFGGLRDKGEGVKKNKLVAKQSWGRKAQHREHS